MSEPDVKMWLAGPLPAEVEPAVERLRKMDDVRHIRLMPDVRLALEVCVGMVIATGGLILPGAVGSDIGCGMSALAFDGAGASIRREKAARLLAELYREVPANRRKASEVPEALASVALSDPRLESIKQRDGRVQLGTLGRGNHFLELQEDEEGRLWLMLHSGSRGIGQAIFDHHSAQAERCPGGIRAMEAQSDRGRMCLHDMAWAVAYAAANRRAMAESAARVVDSVLGAAPAWESYFECCHNHVRLERHGGEEMWVHRKGAIPAGEGERGIIPGSMGTMSFHVEGRGCEASLRSSSHGAGRRMSRSEARRRISARELERQVGEVWYDHRMAGALREEAPGAYRDIEEVMRAQRELTRIVRRLKPVLCYKGA